MKRSEINAIIKEFEAMLKEYHFALPPFLSFTPEEWAEKGHEYDEIRDNALGWDITDYGMGDFDKLGLSLITIRNGNTHNPKYTKTYAEKIMYLRPGQVSPNHGSSSSSGTPPPTRSWPIPTWRSAGTAGATWSPPAARSSWSPASP